MKILSPCGNLESLKLAIFNGADEVYLGINEFNARNNINGFDLNSLKEAVDFAHIFNVKANLAINILFNNIELQKALDIVIDAYNLGVDSFIIQDLGLLSLIHENFPQIEIHASTQMGLHNLEGVKAVEKFGFKRIVLARETPLFEIKRIKENTKMEIEYFAQGALCVSFSGNCYLSSYLCLASGNRGRCKQLCRLPYSFLKNGKEIKSGYLLSAKDFNMIDRLEDLEKAGVDVIKIEGRARRPLYVALATKEYYNVLNKKGINKDNLKLAFNRDYTQGYFNSNSEIISKYNNHIGIFVGKIQKVVLGKKFNEVYFSSNRKLYPKSTFKIFDKSEEKTTISAYDLKEISKNNYMITTTQKLKANDNVHLIIDAKQEERILKETKRRNLNINIFAEIGEKIKAEIILEDGKIEVLGEICEKAKNQPLTKEDLIENFNKSDLFCGILNIKQLDDIFITKQKLNEFRRNVFEQAFTNLTTKFYKNLSKIKIENNYEVIKFKDFQFIENTNEKLKEKNIIYSPEEYKEIEIIELIKRCNKENKNFYLDTPNFALKEDIKFLANLIEKTKIKIVANNYYALNFNTDKIIGWGLNVYNNFTAKVLNLPVLCAESDISTKITAPYMTLRHCPVKTNLNCDCKNCKYSTDFVYKMQNGKELKLKRKKLSTCIFYLTD